jgi:hypothetical protein
MWQIPGRFLTLQGLLLIMILSEFCFLGYYAAQVGLEPTFPDQLSVP